MHQKGTNRPYGLIATLVVSVIQFDYDVKTLSCPGDIKLAYLELQKQKIVFFLQVYVMVANHLICW